MGLDACVYCDCVEKRRLKRPHPYPKQLYIGRNGSPEIRTVDAAKIERHDTWMQLPPCEHEEMNADSSHLGNMGFIGVLRDALTGVSSQLPKCPILLGRVLYNGIHTGDFLSVGQVKRLLREIELLELVDLRLVGFPRNQVKPLTAVTSELRRLAKCALKLKKPIAF
jgi:hypothetical protein